MKLRKIFSNGTSRLIALPPEMLLALHVETGDYLKVELGRGAVIHLTKLQEQSRSTAAPLIKGKS